MQVIMSMEEYQEMKKEIEDFEVERNSYRLGYENNQKIQNTVIRNKDKEISKYKKINDMIVDFFIKNKVNCEEDISQQDMVLGNIEGLMINLFNETKEQFLINCSDCGGAFSKEEVVECVSCGGYFCKDDCAENQLIDGKCEWCRDV